ncbi:MAG: AFG1 family ATPase [Robiginitomaculum sp.]|nr:AFG1 family ATPase [Robiginitomaculum sp.]
MGVVAELQANIDAGLLRVDTRQNTTANKLDDLLQRLDGYTPKRSLLGRAAPAPKGLYIWGGVGRGKSMLMDMFFAQAKTTPKSRVHFHAFMQDVHKRIGAWRKLSAKQRRAMPEYVRGAGDDPIAPTAKAIAARATLLCFDEFHVTDITDAMILSRLFTALFERGVVVVATSNRTPDDLYKHGLNRQLFVPFIEMLKSRLDVIELGGDEDHRLRKLGKAAMYYSPLGPDTDTQIEVVWQRLIRPAKPAIETLNVQGRSTELLAAGDTARASFAELCDRPLGAADYLEIARRFTTLILENVPIMAEDQRNVAKRFVTLIDALYEQKTKLVLSAAAPPEQLYQLGDGAFEFERTTSRLSEMRSDDYLAQAHRLRTANS